MGTGAPGNRPTVWETISGTNSVLVNEIMLEPTGELPPEGTNWIHSAFSMRIYPNPSFEIVRIDGGIMVDEVVIDTICVPEPRTLGLLGLGVLTSVFRRRR